MTASITASLHTLDEVRAPIDISWTTVADYAGTKDVHDCLYVFFRPCPDERPFYIGKAKRLGGAARSRYNPGYGYLIDGLLRAEYQLFVAQLTPTQFAKAVHYEEFLIQKWNPVRNKRRGRYAPWPVTDIRPWTKASPPSIAVAVGVSQTLVISPSKTP